MKARWPFLSAFLSLVLPLLLVACEKLGGNPCRGLAETQGGPPKATYLPRADAMLQSLGQVDAGLVKAARGDKAGRSEALSAMEGAGGKSRLRQSWSDRDMTEPNGHLCNAYEVYKIETTGLAVAAYYRLDRDDVSMQDLRMARGEADRARSVYRSAKNGR